MGCWSHLSVLRRVFCGTYASPVAAHERPAPSSLSPSAFSRLFASDLLLWLRIGLGLSSDGVSGLRRVWSMSQ